MRALIGHKTCKVYKRILIPVFSILITILITPIFILPAFAADFDVESAQGQSLGIDGLESALPSQAKDILGEISIKDSLDTGTIIEKVSQGAQDKLEGIIGHAVKSAGIIIITAMICSLAGPLLSEKDDKLVPLCGSAAISIVAIGDIRAFIGLGTETINILSDFSKVLLPSVAAAASASGAISSATAKFVATSLFVDILITASTRIVMPLLYSYIAVSIASAAIGGESLDAVCSLLKWLCTSVMTLIVLSFTIYISLTGVISGTSDAVASRAAKTAISAALPVVGGILSDAAGTVLAGASILRNAIGVFGMAVVVCICLIPFLTLAAQYLIYKMAGGLANAVSDKRLGSLISNLGGAFAIMLSLVGAGAIMMFVSLISSMRAVSGI